MDIDAPISQKEFAELIGVSQARVSAMVKHGRLRIGGTGRQWLQSYLERQREVGRTDKSAEARDRYLLARAKREEMRTARMAKSLVPAELLELILANYGRRIVVYMEALPATLHKKLNLPQKVCLAIEGELNRARNEMAAFEFPEELVREWMRRHPEVEQLPASDAEADAP